MHIDDIHKNIPVDYYDRGMRTNIFQKIWHIPRIKKITSIVQKFAIPGNQLLDVGCHSGALTAHLASAVNMKMFGTDISSTAICYASGRARDITFFVSNVEDGISFPMRSFAIITCFDVLEHLLDPKKFILNVYNILEDGVVFIFAISNENWLLSQIWPLWLKTRGHVWADTHLHAFSIEALTADLEAGGFIKEQEYFMHCGMYRIGVYRACHGRAPHHLQMQR